MLSETDIIRYMKIQAKGIPVPAINQLVSVKIAERMVAKTKATILTARVDNPATSEEKGITWFVIGAIVMLDKSSLIQEALRRKWIEEV